MPHQMLSSYQGPSACKEPFVNDMFSTADSLALLQKLEVYLGILQLESAINSYDCFAYQALLSCRKSAVSCMKANYTAACTCYRAFLCSASPWKLAAFQSPSVWVRAVFPVLNSHKDWSWMCFLGGRILIKWVRCKNSFFIVETSWHSSRPLDLKNFTDVKRMLVPTSDYFLSLGLQYATYISGPSSNDVTNVIVTFCGRFRWSRSLQTISWQRVGGYCSLSCMNTVASDPTSSGPVPDSWLLLVVHVG